MKTLFIPDFHSHNYACFGIRNVLMIRINIDFRIEGYIFQPYKELLKTADSKTEYSEKFLRPYFVGSAGPVFHTPLGPVCLFMNYYHQRKNPVSILFHFGYLIFNKSAID
jgi:NTE family protein